MLTGRVRRNLQAWLSLEILDGDGQPQAVEVALDTGFEGNLALRPHTVRQLGLTPDGYRYVELANGGVDRLRLYFATVLWDGRPLVVDVIESGSDPLVGMALLEGCRVTVDVIEGGAVVVDAIP